MPINRNLWESSHLHVVSLKCEIFILFSVRMSVCLFRELKVTQGGPGLRARVDWQDSQARWALLDLQDPQEHQDLHIEEGQIL